MLPRSSRQHRMRPGRVRDVRRMAGVGGVEVGVKADRVITVAPQRANGMVMNRRPQSFGDGPRQHRVRADFDKGDVVLPGGGNGLA